MARPAGKVRIGHCVGWKGIGCRKAAGFDFMEMRTWDLAALMTNVEGEASSSVQDKVSRDRIQLLP